jgi:hypothetical protein
LGICLGTLGSAGNERWENWTVLVIVFKRWLKFVKKNGVKVKKMFDVQSMRNLLLIAVENCLFCDMGADEQWRGEN